VNRLVAGDLPVVVVCAALVLALVSVVLVPTLQEALETHLHRALFPTLYDYRRRLRALASEMVHFLDQGELLHHLGDGLREIMDVTSCHVFVEEEGDGPLVLAYPAVARQVIERPVQECLEGLIGPVLASEVDGRRNALALAFRTNAWELVVPLRIKSRLTGVVALGRRRDFRIFSGEDLQLLATVGAGASVALENASLSRQLRRSEVVLERANRLSSLGLLAAGIAHEIRNPLVAVKTFLDLLPQRLEDPEFLTSFRDLSLGELRRVTDLIADLLALGKSKTAERRAVELAPTLEPVVRLMESTARKREVEVAATFEPELPAVWGDPDQLKQIALNLLLNAIEMSSKGGRVELDVRRRPEEGVVLEVRDQGPGIPEDRLETIFHPFFTTKETGTGLGLTLVHQMVVEHGGEIEVESEVGQGTIFRVELPGAGVDLERTGT
jgi:signal transduction histidine kinase